MEWAAELGGRHDREDVTANLHVAGSGEHGNDLTRGVRGECLDDGPSDVGG
jgi:hypothetical protein